MILNSCRYCDDYLSEKELFEVFVKYLPKNFHKLKLHYVFESCSELLPDELESFFTGWANRMSQKSLSLTIIYNDSYTLEGLDKIDGNKKIY